MNTDALLRLAEEAKAFSRTYVAVKESLVMEGVTQDEAKEAARSAAMMAALVPGEEWRSP